MTSVRVDAVILQAAAEAILEHGPMSDDDLLATLQQCGFPPRVSRDSLARLERQGHLAFDATGWTVPGERSTFLSGLLPW